MRFIAVFAVMFLFFAAAACERGSAPKPEEPAHVSGHVAETELATVTLTPEAEKRLGIEVAPIERRDAPSMRVLGGEVISSAEAASPETRYAAAGMTDPSDLAVAQIEADAALARASASLEAARRRYDRVSKLSEAKAESARVREEALADLRIAEADHRAAQSRRALLGQSIAATTPAERLWVRASIYTGDLASLDQAAPAQVRKLGRSGIRREAAPVSAPAASTRSGVSYLVYELDNKDGAFSMGERVEVAIASKGRTDALIAPWSAILYDVNGGEWVYERVGDHAYARRRVAVTAVVGDVAVLARGPEQGAQVVSVGAPELFGTEFGVGH